MRVAAAAAAVLTLSAAGYADDADQANPDNKALLEYVKKLEGRVNQLEQEKDWPLDQVRSQSGSALDSAIHSINFSGYMEFQYNYNLRHGGRTASRGDTLGFNTGHATSNDESSFSFQNLQLLADKPLTTVNSTGFRVRAQYGQVALFDNRDANFNAGNAFDVREAYMSWRMGGWGMTDFIDLSVGKFDSPLGAESPDNTMNWQVTRGPAQAFLLPITHTGIRAAATWSDFAKTTVYVVNGWDNVRDTGDGKTVILSQQFGKFDFLNSTLTINASYGNEGSLATPVTPGLTVNTPDGDKTSMLEAIWRAEIDSDTEVALDGIWFRRQNGAMHAGPIFTGLGSRLEARHVHNLEAYIKHRMTKETWVSGRTGYYADNGLGTNPAVRGYDLTLTVGWDLAADLSLAVEYRHDHSFSGNLFANRSGRAIASQDVVTASMLYRF